MKTNHRRGFVEKGGYYYNMIRKRLAAGMGDDHDNGNRGMAKDMREFKRLEARRDRRRANRSVRKELQCL